MTKHAQSGGHPIYLVIDEYDNFTNALIRSSGKESYRSIAHGTHPRRRDRLILHWRTRPRGGVVETCYGTVRFWCVSIRLNFGIIRNS